MKISRLIKYLQEILESEGDIPVVRMDDRPIRIVQVRGEKKQERPTSGLKREA